MTSSNTNLDALLAALDSTQPSESEQRLNAEAAEMRERLARGEVEAPASSKPTGPDPLGGNWEWLDQPAPPEERLRFIKQLFENAGAIEPTVEPGSSLPSTEWQQKTLYAAIGALAAGLLLSFAFLGRGGGHLEGELAM